MNNKAEAAAIKAYPVVIEEHTERDLNKPRRLSYINGYEQAEKDLGWVSVKDRLPEVGHCVLTCVSDTRTPQCVGVAILLNDGTWWDGDMKVRVDYWMEVPKLKK